MKRIAILATLFVLLLSFTLGTAAFAHEDVHHCHWNSGRDFGQHHAEHARAGHLGGQHNPGNHQGYSLCVP